VAYCTNFSGEKRSEFLRFFGKIKTSGETWCLICD